MLYNHLYSLLTFRLGIVSTSSLNTNSILSPQCLQFLFVLEASNSNCETGCKFNYNRAIGVFNHLLRNEINRAANKHHFFSYITNIPRITIIQTHLYCSLAEFLNILLVATLQSKCNYITYVKNTYMRKNKSWNKNIELVIHFSQPFSSGGGYRKLNSVNNKPKRDTES